ncbi:MAG: OmpA family protein [Opitutales bacterium]
MMFGSGCSKKPGPTPEETALLLGEGVEPPAGGTGGVEFTGGGGDILSNPLNDGEGDILRRRTIKGYDDVIMRRGLFNPVFFGFDQYAIDPDERENLTHLAEFLNREKGTRLIIEGHCDWKGTPEYNQSLGDRRATSVRQYLIDLAVDPSRIDIVSMGDNNAKIGGTTAEMMEDRKAVFVLAGGS